MTAIGSLAALLAGGAATAANRPDYRDCSFSGGIDPDYVELLGATAGPNGSLTVSPSQTSVQVKASESSDPGDNLGHDTLTITVSAPGVASHTVSGHGVGKVLLTAPLGGAAPGSSYTITWAATFDNGNHTCPGSQTPQNPGANPFVLTNTSSMTSGGTHHPAKHTRAHSRCRKAGKHGRRHRRPRCRRK